MTSTSFAPISLSKTFVMRTAHLNSTLRLAIRFSSSEEEDLKIVLNSLFFAQFIPIVEADFANYSFAHNTKEYFTWIRFNSIEEKQECIKYVEELFGVRCRDHHDE